jgi:CRISPR/Cas system CSM-associated protein Csm3 (group 7 of RAMP superfamily)
LVPLTKEAIERRRPVGHTEAVKVGLVSGVLHGRLKALTPVHVGSGGFELTKHVDRRLARETPVIKAHVRAGDRRVIPGSSLKGVIRSIVEAISPSCLRITGRASRRKLPRRELQGCRFKDNLCVACRMFGSLGYLGQVRFSDAVQVSGGVKVVYAPPLYAPRPRVRRYYDNRGNVAGRKFYYHGRLAKGDTPLEACPAGSEFTFSVQFDNLEERELGLLLIALGQGEPKLYPKLGGGKPACLGSVEVVIEALEVRGGKEAYLSYETEGTPADPARYVRMALADKKLVLPRQLAALAEVLRYPSDRECPSRSY